MFGRQVLRAGDGTITGPIMGSTSHTPGCHFLKRPRSRTNGMERKHGRQHPKIGDDLTSQCTVPLTVPLMLVCTPA